MISQLPGHSFLLWVVSLSRPVSLLCHNTLLGGFPLRSLCVFVKPLYDIDESIGLRIDLDDWMAVVRVTEGSEMTEVYRFSSL